MRGIGVVEALAGLPGWVVLVAAVLTQLGDAWFLFLGLSLLYWFGDDRLAANPRRVGATLLAVSIAALAVTTGLKSLFMLPRPAGAGVATPPAWLPNMVGVVYTNVATGTGFGFPSGHAVGATMTYGGLAAFLDVWDRRTRWLAAGGVIAVVSFTRLVLGVHYLVDVVVGTAVGLVALAALHRIARSGFEPRPDRVFFAAAVAAAVAMVVAYLGNNGSEVLDAGIAAGGAFGGYVVWRVRGTETADVGGAAGLLGAVLIATLFVAAYVVTELGLPYVFGVVPDTTPFRLFAVVTLSTASIALVVGWPTVVGHFRRPSVADASGDG